MGKKGFDVLSESELSRMEDCSLENAKLADVWDRDNIVITTIAYTEVNWTGPTFAIEEMPRTIKSPVEWQSIRPVHQYTLRVGAAGTEVRNTNAKSWWIPYDSYEAPPEILQVRFKEIFERLQRKYATVCVASQRLREVLLGMEKLGFPMPKNVVTVDLVKVLEYQTMDGLSEGYRQYLEQRIDIHGRRHTLKVAMEDGMWPSLLVPSKLLEMVGPRAEQHRRDFERARRDNVNLKRIAGRFSNKDLKAMRIMARRGVKGRPPGLEDD